MWVVYLTPSAHLRAPRARTGRGVRVGEADEKQEHAPLVRSMFCKPSCAHSIGEPPTDVWSSPTCTLQDTAGQRARTCHVEYEHEHTYGRGGVMRWGKQPRDSRGRALGTGVYVALNHSRIG